MFHTKDHKTGYLFDHGPFHWLDQKRKKLIDTSWAKLFREEILPNLPVSKLIPFYSPGKGAPTKELHAMLGAIVLQQMHDLTDEETVSQYAFNIQWHYALNITDDSDAYISLKTLWNMRSLLTEHNLHTPLFDTITDTLVKTCAVDTSLQRLDSVHIFSNMRHLGRIGLFVRTIKKFLINLKRHHRELFDALDKARTDRYLSKKDESVFSMVKPSESVKTLTVVGDDLFFLVEQFKKHEAVASMKSYALLVRLLKEQCAVEDTTSTVFIKPNKDVPSDSLQNPSDPDATYDGHKGQGYQTQIMETYSPDKKELSLITYVAVEPAHNSDASALMPAVLDAENRGFIPQEVLADSLYGSDDNCEKAKEHEVIVVSPVMGAKSTKELSLTDFVVSDTLTILTCPEGKCPLFTKQKKGRHVAAFDPKTCSTCPRKDECPVKRGGKGNYLRYDAKTLRLARRRAKEKTTEFREKYRFRSGIEGTISYTDRKTGMKHLRVRGLKAVSFCATLKAAAVNILRAAAFQRAAVT